MTSDRKFYRTVFQVVVLSEDSPIQDGTELDDIAYMITEGDCVGQTKRLSAGEITAKEMVDALEAVGSESSFFELDKDGNPMDEMRCSLCGRVINPDKAHLHQEDFIGDECCWDERLRASE